MRRNLWLDCTIMIQNIKAVQLSFLVVRLPQIKDSCPKKRRGDIIAYLSAICVYVFLKR